MGWDGNVISLSAIGLELNLKDKNRIVANKILWKKIKALIIDNMLYKIKYKNIWKLWLQIMWECLRSLKFGLACVGSDVKTTRDVFHH